MNELSVVPRLATQALQAQLRSMPVVVITGARQTGKSTLVRELLPGERQYFTLDDLDIAELAAGNPAALTSGSLPITIDEVQRQPSLLHAVKMAVDRDRTPGRFLLTGSANLLLMRSISESLAGRAAYLTLRPLSRGELSGRILSSLWGSLLQTAANKWPELIRDAKRDRANWRAEVGRGGFPTPAIDMEGESERQIWYDGYVRTYLERDLLELSNIAGLADFRRLMRLAANRVGQMVNQSELGRVVGLPQPTVHRYLNLLETSYMLVRIPAYSVNRTKRVVRTPKLYWGDTGLALHLAGEGEPDGSHLENLVLNDLLVSRDTGRIVREVYYWRTAAGTEVDFIVQGETGLLPVEVKSSSSPRARDCRGIEVFLDDCRDSVGHGLLLHAGEEVQWLTPRVLAAPWWSVL